MWTSEELAMIEPLDTPEKVQRFIDELPYSADGGAFSPRTVLTDGQAQCFSGALLAAAILEHHGYTVSLIDMVAENDDDHVIVAYEDRGYFGSIAMSNTTMLRGRQPIYRSVRELVASYFDFYFNTEGELSLRSYSDPLPLERISAEATQRGMPDWRFDAARMDYIEELLEQTPHHQLVPGHLRLPKVSRKMIEACFLGANEEGIYKPSSK